MKRKTKSFFIIVVILAAVCVLVAFLMCVLNAFTGSSKPIDFDQRVIIWDAAAGNSNRSKLEDMNIDYSGNEQDAMWAFANAIAKTEYADEERAIDTLTYFHEIKSGYEEKTYTDIPYLIPYTVDNCKGAVIVIPGGGYGYKTMDASTNEGKDVALTLNQHGYSAFVLHYRSNPYEYPIPQLDVQRAVRYLRANAGDYGFDPKDIALIGFSAGGNQVGTYINVIMGENFFPVDYVSDEIDQIEDSVAAAGMIYPALSYYANVPMLFCSFDAETVRNEVQRNQLLNQLDLSKNFHSADIPQVVAYGTNDCIVGMDGAIAYITAAKNAGADITEIVAEGQDHSFGQDYYMDVYVRLLEDSFQEATN